MMRVDDKGRFTHEGYRCARTGGVHIEELIFAERPEPLLVGSPEKESQWDAEDEEFRELCEQAPARWDEGECCGLRCYGDGKCPSVRRGCYAHQVGVEQAKRDWLRLQSDPGWSGHYAGLLSPWQRAAALVRLIDEIERVVSEHGEDNGESGTDTAVDSDGVEARRSDSDRCTNHETRTTVVFRGAARNQSEVTREDGQDGDPGG